MDYKKLSSQRENYQGKPLTKSDCPTEPMILLDQWFNEAVDINLPVNEMSLATCSKDGQPTVRTVLLKGIEAGCFVWYSHYTSEKGTQLSDNPRAELLFYWHPLFRQIRIRGTVSLLDPEESSSYFQSRPLDSQIGAIVSPQSEVIASKEALMTKFETFKTENKKDSLPCPENWGGFLLRPERFEFWQGQPNRLHDRIVYGATKTENWHIERLAP